MDSERATCLRPGFTAALAGFILSGESVNLISPHGQGRRRTLDDLRSFIPGSTMIIQLNMQLYCHDLKGFLKAIASYFNHPDHSVESLGKLFNQLEKENQKVLLILHNFDELWSGSTLKDGYSGAFLEDLNRLREREITLLCVTEYAEQHDLLKADGCKLDAIPLPLPGITAAQLVAEIQHRNLPVEENELDKLAAWLLNQNAPYSMLDELKPAWFKQKSWKE
ncbi:hypothetical protein F3F96_10265 [Mariprofundus sp. NF]|uniref:hypothetical protein n=1 Tax=Mariprofundus sp. NF TaxID=2608716 RepID=UPI0015A4D745|nr:hypothetical protein [Mariprofundus sp. NF]NWF39516.1 hypothetical protein [Mariprofundus sp. NF]